MTYDNKGQTTAKGSVNYTFNVRHQLVTVTGSGYSYQYTYDETGHRVKAVRNGVTTKYIYGNGSRILAEADSAGVITRYYMIAIKKVKRNEQRSIILGKYNFISCWSMGNIVCMWNNY